MRDLPITQPPSSGTSGQGSTMIERYANPHHPSDTFNRVPGGRLHSGVALGRTTHFRWRATALLLRQTNALARGGRRGRGAVRSVASHDASALRLEVVPALV